MLVTDVVLHVSQDPVPVAVIEPEPLLVRGMNGPDQMLPNTEEARSMGWGKTVLFGLLFNPTAVDVRINPLSVNKSFLDGFYWEPKWKDAFKNLTDKDMFVPPILHTLAFPRRGDEVKRWAESVAAWDFERIIPGHLDGPIDATPKQFAAAIDVALTKSSREVFGEDIDTLEQIDKVSRDLKSLEEPRAAFGPEPRAVLHTAAARAHGAAGAHGLMTRAARKISALIRCHHKRAASYTLSSVVSGALPPLFSFPVASSIHSKRSTPSGPRLVAPRPRFDLLVLRGGVKVAHGSQAGGVGEHGQLLVHALGLRGEPLQEDSLLRGPRLLQLRGLVALALYHLLERAEERAFHLGEHRARGVQPGG